MKRLSRLAVAAAATSLLTAGAITASTTAASASTTFGSCSAQGDYATCDACIVAAGAQLQAGGNSIRVSLSYSRTAAPAPVSHEIKGYAGRCADDNGNSSALRAKVQVWNCVNNAAEQWSFSSGELKHGSQCMNDKGTGGNGSPVILWSCTRGSNEVWSHNSHGEYVLKANGLCLDDPAYSTKNGTQLDVYRCSGGSNERWSLP